jgi:hypothetical protein
MIQTLSIQGIFFDVMLHNANLLSFLMILVSLE